MREFQMDDELRKLTREFHDITRDIGTLFRAEGEQEIEQAASNAERLKQVLDAIIEKRRKTAIEAPKTTEKEAPDVEHLVGPPAPEEGKGEEGKGAVLIAMGQEKEPKGKVPAKKAGKDEGDLKTLIKTLILKLTEKKGEGKAVGPAD